MLVLDNNGKLFDDRRKDERRKENVKVDEERRKAERRANADNKKHNENEAINLANNQVVNNDSSSAEVTVANDVNVETNTTDTVESNTVEPETVAADGKVADAVSDTEDVETPSSDEMSEEASNNQE